MKIPHTYVFVTNTKTYVSSQYFVFIHLSNTSFEHTVCEIEGGGGERLETCRETASRKLLVLAQHTDIWTRKKFSDCRSVD
jgi:hypothetical protein